VLKVTANENKTILGSYGSSGGGFSRVPRFYPRAPMVFILGLLGVLFFCEYRAQGLSLFAHLGTISFLMGKRTGLMGKQTGMAKPPNSQ